MIEYKVGGHPDPRALVLRDGALVAPQVPRGGYKDSQRLRVRTCLRVGKGCAGPLSLATAGGIGVLTAQRGDRGVFAAWAKLMGGKRHGNTRGRGNIS